MAKHRVFIASLLLLASSGALAFDNEKYDACMLQYQKQAKTNYAATLIKEACTNLYKGATILYSEEEAYYRCLLENIPGIESDQAVENVRRICHKQSQH